MTFSERIAHEILDDATDHCECNVLWDDREDFERRWAAIIERELRAATGGK